MRKLYILLLAGLSLTSTAMASEQDPRGYHTVGSFTARVNEPAKFDDAGVRH